jgi:hypothetical protein
VYLRVHTVKEGCRITERAGIFFALFQSPLTPAGTMGRLPVGVRSGHGTRSGAGITTPPSAVTPTVAASTKAKAKRGPKGAGAGYRIRVISLRAPKRVGFARCGGAAYTGRAIPLKASGSGRNSSSWTTKGVSQAELRGLARADPSGMQLLNDCAKHPNCTALFTKIGEVLSASLQISQAAWAGLTPVPCTVPVHVPVQ